jgi:tRNA dimethylallyltransferase
VQANSPHKVVAVLGPTCTGKSELALWLASRIGGEIVNADSMQVYKGFDIGSAKPSPAARAALAHHLVDVVGPDQEFNAALFQRMADAAIEEIASRNRIPITVGGTGLYLRVLFHGLFPAPTDQGLRDEIKRRYHENATEVYEDLKGRDPRYALSISPRDGVRVVRALEISLASGFTMSEWQDRHGFREQRYDSYKIGLRGDRQELYGKIDERVERMLAAGWIDEVRGLVETGYDTSLKPFHSIGYREIALYLKGGIDYAAMVERIKTATRHYAKRQFTWFSKEKDIDWYAYPDDRDKILGRVTAFLR